MATAQRGSGSDAVGDRQNDPVDDLVQMMREGKNTGRCFGEGSSKAVGRRWAERFRPGEDPKRYEDEAWRDPELPAKMLSDLARAGDDDDQGDEGDGRGGASTFSEKPARDKLAREITSNIMDGLRKAAGKGRGKAPPASEEAKVQKFSETAAMQHVLEVSGSSPREYVETFRRLKRANPRLTAREYGVS
jgi:hypothetical protein